MSPLSPDDVSVVETARQELDELPLPAARGTFGCLGGLAGTALLAAWPRLLNVVPELSFFSPFAMLFAVAAILGGVVMGVSGGPSGRSAARAAVEAALRVLEDPDAARDEQLRAATVLLTRSCVSQGPSVDLMIDREEATGRIGDRIDVVTDVDRLLVERYGAAPVFAEWEPDG